VTPEHSTSAIDLSAPHAEEIPVCGPIEESGGRLYKIFLLLFIMAVAGFLFFGLFEPFDGFHGFQEAWYAAIAENYSSHSLFMPTTYDENLDLNVPPFFSYLIYISFSLFGPGEAAARIVPVFFSLLSLLAVYLLGETLLRKGAGLETAALFASTSLFLILGRNVQTDIVYVTLSLFCVYFYLKARRSENSLTFVLAGIFLGFSLFTKQFAVIPAAALILFEALGPDRKKLLKKDFLIFLAAAAVVIAPYYGYHLLHDAGRLIRAQLHGSASKAGLAAGPTLQFLLTELLWGCSPLILLGGIAGMAVSFLHFTRNKLLVILSIALFFIFYLFFHRHSYYLFGMIPFLAVSFGWLREQLSQRIYRLILLLSILLGFCLSLYQSFGSNYGGGELKQVGQYLVSYENPVVLADRAYILNYEPLFRYYARNAMLLPRDSESSPAQRAKIRESDGIFSFSGIPIDSNTTQSIPITGTRYGLKVGTRCFIHVPPNVHFLAPAAPAETERYEIDRSLGPFVRLTQVSFFLIKHSGSNNS